MSASRSKCAIPANIKIKSQLPFTIARLIGLALVSSSIAFPATAEDFTNAISAFLQDHVKLEKKSIGIVVGFVDEHGSRVVSFGRMSSNSSPEVNGDALFELGSVTKVFTAELLQDMVESGEMNLNDPVAKYLPATVRMPTHAGQQITLLDLATQTSGLPRDQNNFAPRYWPQPYADCTVEQLYAFLSGYNLGREPGTKYEYSNLGFGLLGHVLARAAHTNYESLLVERICDPLHMDGTRITLSPELKTRSASPHDWYGNPMPDLIFSETLMGNGALHSTANDMLKFLSANMGLMQSPISSTMKKTHVVRFQNDQALGWAVSGDVVYHNGGTFGSASFVGFDTKQRRGVVVLSNKGFDHKGSLGFFLLNSEWQTDKRPAAVRLDPRIYDSCVGKYQLRTNYVVDMRREGDRLLAQIPGLPLLELLPQSETNFFLRVSGKTAAFIRDSQGEVKSLTMDVNGIKSTLAKIPNEPPTPHIQPEAPVIAKVDGKLLDAAVGRYKLASGRLLTLHHAGDHLVAVYEGWFGFELSTESENKFFCNYTPLTVTFVKDDQAKMTGLMVSCEVFSDEFTGKASRF